MMNWEQYLQSLLQEESEFDKLAVSLNKGVTYIGVPSIIKASILMLDRMLEHQGKHNVFVFPEKSQSGFLFALMKLLHNISTGKIQHNYDPDQFKPGEKLKLGNAVAECVGTTVNTRGQKCLTLHLADLTYTAPVEILPFLQRTDTAKRLSKDSAFQKAKKEALAKTKLAKLLDSPISLLGEYKSHMESSIFYMSPIITSKNQLETCLLNETPASELVLVGKASYDGTIQNAEPGQLKGIPAIVLASDLYSIHAAIENGSPAQSLIIDASNNAQLSSQTDVLDDLCRLDIPILCITDTANSFDLDFLKDRDFNIWRWDSSSLIPELYQSDEYTTVSNKRLKNCAKQKITYIPAESAEITAALQRITRHKGEIDEQSPQMFRIFETLNRLLFAALREIIGFTGLERADASNKLQYCLDLLNKETPYIPETTLDDYRLVIDNLEKIYSDHYRLPKIEAFGNYLKTHHGDDVCIVVPEHTDKELVQGYWNRYCLQEKTHTTISVLYPNEYIGKPILKARLTLVVGWLRRAIMRKLLFSYKTQNFAVLLYSYESRWCSYDTQRWNGILKKTGNATIIKESFSIEKPATVLPTLPMSEVAPSTEIKENELDTIAKTIQDGRLRRYQAHGTMVKSVDALPVNFAGDYIAFFREGHALVSATKIITEDADAIRIIRPRDLQIGDFIVMRETDRDIIKEIADRSLAAQGKAGYRALATKWKDALQIQLLFMTFQEFCDKLHAAGCTKGNVTIDNWCNDENMIAPQDKEDLRLIAKVCENDVLTEKLDQIYEAARDVKAAHTQAGLFLSSVLRKRIADELKNYGDIDPFNIWDPIELNLEGIGTVRILKVIDINEHRMITVDASDTNRLMADT